ncbi:MAG: SAM-dependent methyltransferase [Bacteroidota bacterium]
MKKPQGKLYLIPTTLGDIAPLEVLPISIKRAVEDIDHYIVENEKSARRFIKKMSPRKSQSGLQIQVLNKYTEPQEIPNFLLPCLEGIPVGILSEAGCPGVADPGAEVVRLAHQKKIKVIPLVGPSSIILALMGSGLNGQNFAFNGYLPIERVERKRELKRLEKLSKEKDQAQIFIETPYRNDKLLADMQQALSESTHLCIASDITLPTEDIFTKSIAEWKKHALDLHRRPTIFIFQAESGFGAINEKRRKK